MSLGSVWYGWYAVGEALQITGCINCKKEILSYTYKYESSNFYKIILWGFINVKFEYKRIHLQLILTDFIQKFTLFTLGLNYNFPVSWKIAQSPTTVHQIFHKKEKKSLLWFVTLIVRVISISAW